VQLTKRLNLYTFIIISTVVTTLVATPNLNKDALIIPKVMALCVAALVIFPYVANIKKVRVNSKILRFTKIIIFLLVLQLIFVTLNSQAPIEQQIFGRTGRGLGLITLFSLLIVLAGCVIAVNQTNYKILVKGLAISGSLSALYAVFQSYGLDFFPWDSRTNGVLGTLGNPNFVSSFAAMSLIPTLVIVYSNKRKTLLQIFSLLFFVFTIYRAQSYQGYVNLILSISIFIAIWLWYKKKALLGLFLPLLATAAFLAVAGAVNKGPLAEILYKVSVQSRGEFWRSAVATANAYPIFGVGLDSFGDYSLMYRDRAIINEYTDSAHNYLLDFAAVGGYPLSILYFLIVCLSFFSFFKIFKNSREFNSWVTALFASFLVYQAQSLISPISIPLILWGIVISGSVIGLAINTELDKNILNFKAQKKFHLLSATSVILVSSLLFPYFNTDRLQLNAMNRGDGDLAIKVSKMFPESVARYSTLSRALLDSGLPAPALELGRSAVEFNPNSAALWALILINPVAPIEERKSAKAKLLLLDPLNKEIINYEITP
jgi:O-antigen ligase